MNIASTGRVMRSQWLISLRLRLRELVDAWDTFDYAILMTLALLMLYAGDYWYLKHPLVILCTAAMIFRQVRSSEIFWFALTAILFVGNALNWYLIDNHKYLISYWCLAIYLASMSPARARVLALSARYLIGLVFLFAVVWKLISSNFTDGTFFHYSLLMDDRFSALSSVIGKISPTTSLQNQQAINSLLSYASVSQGVSIQSTLSVYHLSQFLTWWTLIIESIVAISFLYPLGKSISKFRDVALITFVLSTYLLAPVIGFGWVLIIMGATQSTLTSKYTRLLYLGSFFVLQIYLVPWQGILVQR